MAWRLNVRSLTGLAFGGALALMSAGCATTQPQSPAQAVYAAEASLTEALQVATTYASLPQCPQLPACSDPATVRRMSLAGQTAAYQIQAARITVMNSASTPTQVQSAVASATQALASLLIMTNQVKLK